MHAVLQWLIRWAARVAFGMLVLAVVVTVIHRARSEPIEVDALILTGVDVSGSIKAPELALQLDGIGIAMQSPEIQAAIRHGKHKRIGFAVYLWADGNCPLVAQWRVISSPDDAAQAHAEIQARLAQARVAAQHSSLTDLSKAMQCGQEIISAAPFKADRSVLNIVSNGVDNVGPADEPGKVRDQLQAAHIQINAVALPGGTNLTVLRAYFQKYVVSPIGFVLSVDKAEGLIDVWRRKFIGDLS